ncbi:tRNA-splicing endonuclease subunit sen54 N-term-domain-containing protein [Lactarius quietus]|nr:tRNA-splicing endonuclease subunit sen54 N-term-domain-containing protein [Lactarius quietus]
MDDNLEQPNTSFVNSGNEDHEQDSSGDEDGGLDWTKLPVGNNAARPMIPKRGEKDFEPTNGGGSGLQRHNLERARLAMFDALRSTRAISSKSVSYAVWYPDLARAHVTVARGVHFTSMGHSVQRPSKKAGTLPEEALYLIEKGALSAGKLTIAPTRTPGAPMSVQQAYAEMIGKQDVTLDRYHTFSYLRRLGYIVTRATPPSPAYPVPAAQALSQQPATALIFRRVLVALCSPIRRLWSWVVQPLKTWWRPLVHRPWLHHNMDYPSIFKTLRFISSGHAVPLPSRAQCLTGNPSSPYEIFYHLYKPNTPYRKTAPPQPDFSIVVVNARATPMPTLAELTHMYKGLPTIPPPLPRNRKAPPATSSSVSKPPPPAEAVPRSFLTNLLSYILFRSTQSPPEPAPLKPNPFMALRQGKKTVIVAAVDAGIGAFEEWPMA